MLSFVRIPNVDLDIARLGGLRREGIGRARRPPILRFHITYIVRNHIRGQMKWPSIRPLLSTRRPLHGPPAQNMHMKMRHALAAIRSVIDNEPKTRVMETFLPRDGLRDMDQVAQKRFVGDGGGRHARDFPFRDDQNMDRGCGMDIMKSQAAVVFIGDPGRDFAGDDLRENRAHAR